MTTADDYWAFAIANIAPLQLAMGAVAGFLATRFTMTKKERVDANQKIFENSKDLMLAQNARYQDFTAAFQKYVNKSDPVTIDDFLSIANAGTNYFHQLMITSGAILDDKVSIGVRDESLVPAIQLAVTKNLPSYYRTLQSIAMKKGFDYEGKLLRSNYEALYVVVEKYGSLMPSDEVVQ